MNLLKSFKMYFQKLTIVLLVFLFAFSSTVNVLAFELSQADAPADDQVSSNETKDNLNDTTLLEGTDAEKIFDLKVEDKKSTDSSDAIPDANMSTLDSGEGNTGYRDERKPILNKLKVETDNTMGAMVYSYSLEVPPGRNSMQPDLKLVYNNQNVEKYSVFGYGWTINIPYIERLNKKGLENMYSQYYFTSYLDGELIRKATTSNEYNAKIENGSFNKYEYINDTYWKMTDKRGMTYNGLRYLDRYIRWC